MRKLYLNFDPFPELQTPRLVLRKISVEDKAAILRLRSDAQVMKYLGRPKMKSLEEAAEFIKLVETSKENIEWALCLKEEHALIGKIGFWRMMKAHFRAEIGYSMFPEYFGKGLMSEAMQAVLEYGFKQIKLHSVEANLDPLNLKSKNILERNGFKLEAHYKENYFYAGNFYDTFSYSLLERDWKNK